MRRQTKRCPQGCGSVPTTAFQMPPKPNAASNQAKITAPLIIAMRVGIRPPRRGPKMRSARIPNRTTSSMSLTNRLCNGAANHVGAESPNHSVFWSATSRRRQESARDQFTILPRHSPQLAHSPRIRRTVAERLGRQPMPSRLELRLHRQNSSRGTIVRLSIATQATCRR